jgi:hypothetical protein
MIKEALIAMALAGNHPTMYENDFRPSDTDFWKWKMQARTHNGHRKHGHKKQRGTRK